MTINYGFHLHNPETDDLLAKWAFSDIRLESGTDLITRLDISRNTGHMRARELLGRISDDNRRKKALNKLDTIEQQHLDIMVLQVQELRDTSEDEKMVAKAEEWLDWYSKRKVGDGWDSLTA